MFASRHMNELQAGLRKAASWTMEDRIRSSVMGPAGSNSDPAPDPSILPSGVIDLSSVESDPTVQSAASAVETANTAAARKRAIKQLQITILSAAETAAKQAAISAMDSVHSRTISRTTGQLKSKHKTWKHWRASAEGQYVPL